MSLDPLPSHECAYVILECSPSYPKLITTYTQPIALQFGIQAQLNLLNKIHTKKGEKHANDQPNNNCDIFKYKDSDTTMQTIVSSSYGKFNSGKTPIVILGHYCFQTWKLLEGPEAYLWNPLRKIH